MPLVPASLPLLVPFVLPLLAPGPAPARPPVTPVAVLARFRPPASDYGPGHRGVDLLAHVGQEVRSATAGTVAFAGTVAGTPVLTVVGHDGWRVTLEPVSAIVDAGQAVQVGEVVGTVAPGGHCPLTCLHVGLRRGETYRDPTTLLDLPVLKRTHP